MGQLLGLLGIPIPDTGSIGANCLGFNLDAVLDNQCTNTNIFNCAQTLVSGGQMLELLYGPNTGLAPSHTSRKYIDCFVGV